MFQEELIFLDINCESQEQLYSEIANKLEASGYVKPSYLENIIDREEKFPTAIQTEVCGVAIPHTDSEHILKHGIAIVRLSNSCNFKEMVTLNNVKVKLLFFLLVKDKEKQVTVLSRLMGNFSNRYFLNQLLEAQTASEVLLCVNKEGEE
ncbi:PTS sugar transporter subunit IIA [Vagococcus sp. PNs007]|uniref:PTS sugar transporter subunit IIA n=1 Tax=Vagococcus proximus TaxID=2991417 RepID=A0ABT5X3T1_9ENTE|nr:PTS sugar transporter subunit IIA [Vagococcus proximus]MDF0480654.1 PTS sugar transporter subunit IIA [Vagococcus proximus]